MILKKTDRRFKLYQYGFDCYVEFGSDDWNNYNCYMRYCRANLGNEFWEFLGRGGAGNWRGNAHYRNRRWNSKRIYFRGEKYYTLLLMAMPVESKETFYL